MEINLAGLMAAPRLEFCYTLIVTDIAIGVIAHCWLVMSAWT